jgi:hypothetical protein
VKLGGWRGGKWVRCWRGEFHARRACDGKGVNWSDKTPLRDLTDIGALRVCSASPFELGDSPATVSEILQVARIFIPQREPPPTELCTPIRPERRRTPRRHIPIPLFVYGHAPEGHPFYEETFTSTVNVHGGSMRLETSVQLGQRLLVTNEKNECAQPCIVVFVGTWLDGGVDVAFSFTAAMPYFWRTPGTEEFSATEMEWDPAGSAVTE